VLLAKVSLLGQVPPATPEPFLGGPGGAPALSGSEAPGRQAPFLANLTQPRGLVQPIALRFTQGFGVQPRLKPVQPGASHPDQETPPLVVDLRQ
jgi:hypothetical protein